MRIVLYIFFLFWLSKGLAQAIPIIGNSSTLEVANWNIEWFGDSLNGPADRGLQLKNVANVINTADVDIWGLAEVSNPKYWDSLKFALPDYIGVISTWSQGQKTALLYKKSMFSFLYQRHILSVFSSAFAGGRLPLEVALKYNHNSKTDTLYVLVLHMKANLGTPSERQTAYDNRSIASVALKSYLDTASKFKKYFVIGDWNDDLDESTFDNLTTPYVNFLADSARYFFPTKRITDAGGQSMTSYKEVIDHQLITVNTKYYYISGSSDILNLKNEINAYASTTSDHYPVYSKYDFSRVLRTDNPKKKVKENVVFFDGSRLRLNGDEKPEYCTISDVTGRILYQGTDVTAFIPQKSGVIYLRLQMWNNYNNQAILVTLH